MSTPVDPTRRSPRASRRREPDPSETPVYKRPLVIVGAVVALVVVVVAGFLLLGGSDDSDTTPKAQPAPSVKPLEEFIVLAPASVTDVDAAAQAIGCSAPKTAPVAPEGSSSTDVCRIGKKDAVIITFPDTASLQAWAGTLPKDEFSGAPATTATVAVLVNDEAVAAAVRKGFGV